MKVVEVEHPLVKHKIGLMREGEISTKRFRELATEVGSLLTYEATSDFETERVIHTYWDGPVEADQIKGKSNSSANPTCWSRHMMDGKFWAYPKRTYRVVGIYRDEETLEPVPYFNKLASNIDERIALVVDPMLATGGSMIATIDLMKEKGCKHFKISKACSGSWRYCSSRKAHPDVELYTAAIDEKLNDKGYIVPARRCWWQDSARK